MSRHPAPKVAGGGSEENKRALFSLLRRRLLPCRGASFSIRQEKLTAFRLRQQGSLLLPCCIMLFLLLPFFFQKKKSG